MRIRNYILEKNLLLLQEQNGLTQTEAAHRCGTTAPNWNRWVNGKSDPDLPQLIKIAEGFGVSLDWLTRGKEPQSANVQPGQTGRPAVTVLPSILTLVNTMTPEEQREVMEIIPAILRIVRAAQSGDESSSEAWRLLKGTVGIYDRATPPTALIPEPPAERPPQELTKPKRRAKFG